MFALWANQFGFGPTLEETLRRHPNFRWDPPEKISTKPPLIFIEAYDYYDGEDEPKSEASFDLRGCAVLVFFGLCSATAF